MSISIIFIFKQSMMIYKCFEKSFRKWYCTDHRLILEDIQVIEYLAYNPTAATLILAAILRILADLPGRCC